MEGYMKFHFAWTLPLTLWMVIAFQHVWILPIVWLYSFFGVPVSEEIYLRVCCYANYLMNKNLD